jgi:hypothetical protein
MASQLGTYATRMDRRGSHSSVTVSFVKLRREKYVRRLAAAIRDEWFIGSPLEVWIFQVDIRKSMTGRCQIDQPPTGVKERCDAVDKDEVAKMIAAELRLESISGMAEWRCHHSCIGNDYVERFTFYEQCISAGPHALKICEIEFDQFERSTVSASWRTCSVATLALTKSRAAPTTCAPCAASDRPVSTTSPAETPVTRIRLPFRFTPAKTSSVVEVSPKAFAISSSSFELVK